MSIKVDIIGFKEVNSSLSKMTNVIDEEITKALNDEGITWRDDARQNTPVGETGDLRRSMTFEGVKKSNNKFIMELTNNVEYASFVELGHRTRGGKSFVKGRYMMKNATINLDERLKFAIPKALNNATRKLD